MSISGVTTGSYGSMAASGTSLANLPTTSFGVSFFIKADNGLGPGTSANQFFIGTILARTGSTTTAAAALTSGGANSRWEAVTDNANFNTASFASNAESAVAADEWVHIAWWYELTAGSATRVTKVWVDGVPLTITATDPDAAPNPLNAWNTMYFGAHPTSGGSGPFAGKVAECCLLDAEPTDDEIAEIALLRIAPNLVLPGKITYYNPCRDTADLTAPLIGTGTITLAGDAAMDDADHPDVTYELSPEAANDGYRKRQYRTRQFRR